MSEQTIENRNDSYMQVLDTMAESRKRVVKALHELGNASNREISVHLGLPVNCITGRCKELRKDGIVIESGTKFDNVTDRNVTTFCINWGMFQDGNV